MSDPITTTEDYIKSVAQPLIDTAMNEAGWVRAETTTLWNKVDTFFWSVLGHIKNLGVASGGFSLAYFLYKLATQLHG